MGYRRSNNLIKYDWSVLKAYDIKTIHQYIYFLEYKTIKNKSYYPACSKIAIRSVNKSGFILNPRDLLKNIGNKVYHKEYLYLASLRNYADYILDGEVGLRISILEALGINIERLHNNPLLTMTSSSVYFKYELEETI